MKEISKGTLGKRLKRVKIILSLEGMSSHLKVFMLNRNFVNIHLKHGEQNVKLKRKEN